MGLFLTTKFFGMKINRYMHDFGIAHQTLAEVAAKNYHNGSLNPFAYRRKPLSAQEILSSRMVNYPLTQYMFCSPDEGAAAVVVCSARVARRYTDQPVYLRSTVTRTRRFGAFEVHSPSAGRHTCRCRRRPSTRPPRRSSGRESARARSRSPSCRTPTPARRSSTWPSAGCARTASRAT